MTSMTHETRLSDTQSQDAFSLSSSVPANPQIPHENSQTRPKSNDNRVKMKYFQSLGMNQPPKSTQNSLQNHHSTAHSFSNHSLPADGPHSVTFSPQIKRERGKTSPNMTTVGFEIPQDHAVRDVASSEGQNAQSRNLGHRKKRSISVPDVFNANPQPLVAAIPIPVRGALGEALRNHQVDSDDDSFPSNETDSVDGSDHENDDTSGGSADQDGDHLKGNRRKSKGKKDEEFIPPHLQSQMAQKDSFQVGTARSLALWETRRRAKMNVI